MFTTGKVLDARIKLCTVVGPVAVIVAVDASFPPLHPPFVWPIEDIKAMNLKGSPSPPNLNAEEAIVKAPEKNRPSRDFFGLPAKILFCPFVPTDKWQYVYNGHPERFPCVLNIPA